MTDAAQAVQEKFYCFKCSKSIENKEESYVISKNKFSPNSFVSPRIHFHSSCFQDAAGDEYTGALKKIEIEMEERIRRQREEEEKKRKEWQESMKNQTHAPASNSNLRGLLDEDYKTYIQGQFNKRRYPPSEEDILRDKLKMREETIRDLEQKLYKITAYQPLGPISFPKDFEK